MVCLSSSHFFEVTTEPIIQYTLSFLHERVQGYNNFLSINFHSRSQDMMEFEDEGPLHVKTEEDTAVDFLIGVLS